MKDILIAIVIAVLWVSLVMLAAFVGESGSMLNPSKFETTGKIVVLSVVVYLFDILIAETRIASSLESIKGYYILSLMLVMFSLLVLYFTILFTMSTIVTILLISVFMSSLKGICVFRDIKQRHNNSIKLTEIK